MGIELILVMKLPQEETVALGWKLGLASALMVALGYPGEIQDDLTVRWFWWALAMLPFCYVVMTLVGGLNEATSKQPDSVKGLVVTARYLTVISWLTYPFVYIIKTLASQVPTLQHTSRLATPSQTLSPKPCLAFSFGPLHRGSLPRRRMACSLSELYHPFNS